MKDILSGPGRAALEDFARSNVVVGFDYDGTLAPIAARPEEALMRPSTERLLADLTRRYLCAVVSGRARDDVLHFVGGLPLLRVVGNHGVEWDSPLPDVPRLTIARWRYAMEKALAGLEGVRVEDKTWSLSVHWRLARPKAAARERVLCAAAAIEGARLIHGKDVVNLVHPRAADKGKAIEQIRRELGCDAVIYVGDDVTDEDVFALGRQARVLAIRVGRTARSKAPYYLRSQHRIDDLLSTLLALRPAARQAASR